MRYARIGGQRRGRLLADGLNGGLNMQALPTAVADDQLTDAENLWWHDGALRTRPAVRVADTAADRGDRQYPPGGAERYVTRTRTGWFVTGEVAADGTVRYNVADRELVGERVLRVPYDVRRLDGWVMGKGDGTLVFLEDGHAVAPLAGGGYIPLDDFVYVPTLLTGGHGVKTLKDPPPATVWTERPNLLTPAFRASYTTDGEGIFFYLPVKELSSKHPIVGAYTDETGMLHTHTIPVGASTENEAGSDGLCMKLSKTQRCVYFTNGTDTTRLAPSGAGISDNFTVTAYQKQEQAALIGSMQVACWYGGENGGLAGGSRLMLAGNPRCKNRVYWSDSERPLYFPDDNYMAVGSVAQAVTAFGKQGELLVIFKEHELYAASYRSAAVSAGDVSGARFALFPLHSEVGCDCPGTVRLCHNRLVWLTSACEVYTLASTGAYSGGNLRLLSRPITPRLKMSARWDRQRASAVCVDGWYYLLVGGEILLFCADDAAFSQSTGADVAWYRWRFPSTVFPERLVEVEGQMVMIDNDGRGYTFGGVRDTAVEFDQVRTYAIPSRFRTRCFDFGHADRCKSVRTVTVSCGALDDGALSAEYETEHGQQCDCRRYMLRGREERSAALFAPYRFTPNARAVRRFSLALTATGAVAFGALTVDYDIAGAKEKGEWL